MELQPSVFEAGSSPADVLDPWRSGGWTPGSTAKAISREAQASRAAPLGSPGVARATATRQRTRVLLADERAISRLALGAWLGTDPALELVGKAGAPDDIEDLAMRVAPDAVVLVCDRAGHPFTALARRLRREHPRTRIIVFSHDHNERSCAAATAAEADGHVCENDRPDEVLLTVRGRGIGALASPLGRSRCVECRGSAAPPLSARERDVLVHLARGLSAKQVAGELGIRAKTVDNHTQRLMKKVGLHSRADVVLFAVRQGYVEV